MKRAKEYKQVSIIPTFEDAIGLTGTSIRLCNVLPMPTYCHICASQAELKICLNVFGLKGAGEEANR